MSESGKQALLDLGTLQTMGTVTCLPPPQDPSAGAQERKGGRDGVLDPHQLERAEAAVTGPGGSGGRSEYVARVRPRVGHLQEGGALPRPGGGVLRGLVIDGSVLTGVLALKFIGGRLPGRVRAGVPREDSAGRTRLLTHPGAGGPHH